MPRIRSGGPAVAALVFLASSAGCLEYAMCNGADHYHEARFHDEGLYDELPASFATDDYAMTTRDLDGRSGFVPVSATLDTWLGPGRYEVPQLTWQTGGLRLVLHDDKEVYVSHAAGISEAQVRDAFTAFMRQVTHEGEATIAALADDFAGQHTEGHVRHAITVDTEFHLDPILASIDLAPGERAGSEIFGNSADWHLQVSVFVKEIEEMDAQRGSGLHVDAADRATYRVVSESGRRPDMQGRVDEVFAALSLGPAPTDWSYDDSREC